MKNIILDLAGVILNLNLERDTHSLAAAGLPDWSLCMHTPQLRETLLDFLNGLTSWNEFRPAIRPFCKENLTEQELYNAMYDVLDTVPSSRIDWILELKKNYRVFLFSNINAESWRIAKRRFEASGHTVEECFDKVFLSYEMQLAKPDPRIYQTLLSETGILPEETVYLDDTQENVAMGSSFCLKSYCVEMNHLEKSPFYKETANIQLRDATIDDIDIVAWTFLSALGWTEDQEPNVRTMCGREDTLYSWKRSRIVEVNGQPAGCLISYPGAEYETIREQTWRMLDVYDPNSAERFEPETFPGEYYLDSLAVLPEYRGMGLSKVLLLDGAEKARRLGISTITLIAESDHHRLLEHYHNIGFVPIGEMDFFGHRYTRMKL